MKVEPVDTKEVDLFKMFSDAAEFLKANKPQTKKATCITNGIVANLLLKTDAYSSDEIVVIEI